jgi:hypothetical protein
MTRMEHMGSTSDKVAAGKVKEGVGKATGAKGAIKDVVNKNL